ncbi:[LSU ribosomal protein L11P]-lysine N-methyltransferase [Marinospirillum celere]|uniref:Ribosomal protein L11 methyltransferase n=1 Tax=Marinospirillum celere TaxID=1122252 RepID=A0A1I1E3P1_9GAMM|nr:50S ribosomal protein L11 methyltransferase [Marinospirillum celere]SFB81272.1 [LSU ribosomal protein L11P]-lysine N-methyltransferase [Marinospirillum celere]
MSWLQIKTLVNPEQSAILEDWLLEAGACAITLTDAEDNPVFEPIRGTTPLWQATWITGLYDGQKDAQAMKKDIQQRWQATYPDQPAPELHLEILEDKDWIREWMDSFSPIQMGQRLWVVPSWHQPPEPKAVNLMLDPGLAFGTGTHPTTALCLAWLDAQDLEGKNLLDFGCGSGILGIAGLLLGASQAWGVDIDPQALEASRQNSSRNGLAKDAFPVYYPERCPELQVDVLIANILAGPLIDLAPTLAAKVKPKGLLALSGILAHQAHEVIQAYQPWFDLDPIQSKDEWVRITGQRKNGNSTQ